MNIRKYYLVVVDIHLQFDILYQFSFVLQFGSTVNTDKLQDDVLGGEGGRLPVELYTGDYGSHTRGHPLQYQPLEH